MSIFNKTIILLGAFILVGTSSSFALVYSHNGDPGIKSRNVVNDSLLRIHKQSDSIERQELIRLNEISLRDNSSDSTVIRESLAVLYAKNNDALAASKYIKEYMRSTRDMSILNDHLFSDIKETPEYLDLKDKYQSKLGFIPILYAFTGILGLFIFILLNSRKKLDRTAVLLISCFVLFHSLFILHISVHASRYYLKIPHSLFATAPFSFLYGPLLYFYFKRVVKHHRFTLRDLIHLIPTVLLILYLIPYYSLNAVEKFNLMFDHSSVVLPGVKWIAIFKVISLGFYAWATFKIYKKQYKGSAVYVEVVKGRKKIWERNVLIIFMCYVCAYLLYACVITKVLDFEPLLNLQIIVMVVMVFYIATISFLQPDIFKGKIELGDLSNLFKYSRSGLTASYSNELKERLLDLMNNEKIFKQNDLNLDRLSETLGTTRHNASQVINEHFNMSFFELMNFYRIMEAQDIFADDKKRNLNIIDVAYEVGYNNKVTFNKAFKKQLKLTPTQFIRSLEYNPRFLRRA